MKNVYFRLLSVISAIIVPLYLIPQAGAVFVPSRDFDDYQYITIKNYLDENNVVYFIFSDTYDTLRGFSGTEVIPFTITDSIDPNIVDFLVIIGGPGILKYFDYQPLMSLIQELDSMNVPMGGVKMAPSLIVKSGSADEKICVYINKYIQEQLEAFDVKFVAYDIYTTGNIVTSYDNRFVRLFIQTLMDKVNETAGAESQ